MKQVYLIMSVLFLVSFSGCSKTPDEPYYDRAQNASQKAQSQLRRD